MKYAIMLLSVYKAVCDKIRALLGLTDTIKADELPEMINGVYAIGQKTERDKFWDAFQNNGNRTAYPNSQGVFSGYNFNFDNFYPKYDIRPEGNANQLFYAWTNGNVIGSLSQRLKECGVVLDTSKATSMGQMFSYTKFTELPAISFEGVTSSASNNIRHVFANNPHLETIEKIIVTENTYYQTWFADTTNLKNVTFEGIIGQNGLDLSPSTSLTKDSLMNVINCLMAYTVADELILPDTSGSVVLSNAKLIEGKNYLMEFRSYQFNGASSPLYVGSQNMTASKVNIEGVGERVGVWRECNFWADPDIYWYRVYVYQDGDDIKELRCIIDKQTGKVIPYALAGDILSLKVDQTETHSVPLGTTNLAKLTDDEKAIATRKGWTLN
jgi:hypothetical protein